MKKIRQSSQFRTLKNTVKSPSHFLTNSNILRWLLVLLVVYFLYWLFSSSYFRIQNIECSSVDDIPCDANVLAELDRQKGKLIFTINTMSIEDKVEKADPIYSGVEVLPVLPNTLVVTMNKNTSYANILVASNSASLIVDQNHTVVDKQPAPTPGAFIIISSLASQYAVGDKISDKDTLIAFDLADELKRNYLPFKKINYISISEIEVTLQDGRLAIFTSTEDVPRQVTSLQLILSKATISPEPRIFDMRFNMPVLKY